MLTAVEDFLAAPEGAGWSAIILPVAYGLAILYRPADALLTAACREKLHALQEAAATTAPFFQACEQNYLQLYLHGEYAQHLAATAARDLQDERAAHCATLAAYAELERAYVSLSAPRRTSSRTTATWRASTANFCKLTIPYRMTNRDRRSRLTRWLRLLMPCHEAACLALRKCQSMLLRSLGAVLG